MADVSISMLPQPLEGTVKDSGEAVRVLGVLQVGWPDSYWLVVDQSGLAKWLWLSEVLVSRQYAPL